MRAELRSLDSADVTGCSLEEYAPEQRDDFSLLVAAGIGIEGQQGEDLFDFQVTTPRRLQRVVEQHGPQFLDRMIVMPYYDYSLLWQAISDLCAKAEGPDWQTVARWLGHYGSWEFEGMSD